ncbi:hypothetical protein Nepgr_000596 [Nepenthes gracilis]|uniref:Uncharacterized protein n=1 Tax=Nepenthes gracilis TaxID=150966 RepID=A0AAD3RVJ6_NEPGR|nr:hypothetical protein Nepgr_000596 [Nepenthes gracilis]
MQGACRRYSERMARGRGSMSFQRYSARLVVTLRSTYLSRPEKEDCCASLRSSPTEISSIFISWLSDHVDGRSFYLLVDGFLNRGVDLSRVSRLWEKCPAIDVGTIRTTD